MSRRAFSVASQPITIKFTMITQHLHNLYSWCIVKAVVTKPRPGSICGCTVNEGWCNYRLTRSQKTLECGVPIAAACSIFSRLSEGCSGGRRDARARRRRGGRGARARGGARPAPPQSSRAFCAVRTHHDALSGNKCVVRGTSRERTRERRLITADSVLFLFI